MFHNYGNEQVCMDGRMHAWLDGFMDGCIYGCTYARTYVSTYVCRYVWSLCQLKGHKTALLYVYRHVQRTLFFWAQTFVGWIGQFLGFSWIVSSVSSLSSIKFHPCHFNKLFKKRQPQRAPNYLDHPQWLLRESCKVCPDSHRWWKEITRHTLRHKRHFVARKS